MVKYKEITCNIFIVEIMTANKKKCLRIKTL